MDVALKVLAVAACQLVSGVLIYDVYSSHSSSIRQQSTETKQQRRDDTKAPIAYTPPQSPKRADKDQGPPVGMKQPEGTGVREDPHGESSYARDQAYLRRQMGGQTLSHSPH